MTTDEIIEVAIQGLAGTRDAIRWAVLQERKECAQLCDKADKSTHPSDLADLIRARGNHD